MPKLISLRLGSAMLILLTLHVLKLSVLALNLLKLTLLKLDLLKLNWLTLSVLTIKWSMATSRTLNHVTYQLGPCWDTVLGGWQWRRPRGHLKGAA